MGAPLNSTTFKLPNFFSESFSMMDELRQERHFCDVVLKVDDESFYAHRSVLASASPYFLAMFTNDLMQKKMVEITMHDVDSSTLKQLIDFVYRGELRISQENVHRLLAGASYLQMERVQVACTDFLADQ